MKVTASPRRSIRIKSINVAATSLPTSTSILGRTKELPSSSKVTRNNKEQPNKKKLLKTPKKSSKNVQKTNTRVKSSKAKNNLEEEILQGSIDSTEVEIPVASFPCMSGKGLWKSNFMDFCLEHKERILKEHPQESSDPQKIGLILAQHWTMHNASL